MNPRGQLQRTLGTTYTLERELGGGMARVYLAEEPALGRRGVVKVLPPELSAGVNAERFRREIRLAAQLQHPHIVPVLQAGESGEPATSPRSRGNSSPSSPTRFRASRSPRNESPARRVLTAEQYQALRAAAATFDNPRVGVFLILAHETGHRAASIRKLRWSDIDLEGRVVCWRAENDKIGDEHTTPLTDEAVALLRTEQARVATIGDAWVFPTARGSGPLTKDAAMHYWKRLAAHAGVPAGERYGWHSVRRQFASELKQTNLKDLCELGGWKAAHTLLTCYVAPDPATQREALKKRRAIRSG